MSALKSSLSVLVVLSGLSGAAQAQGIYGGNGFAGYPGAGTNQGYYSLNSGFGNYGLPGSYPNYQGYGFAGYGPGSIVGGYWGTPNVPRTYNNLGGLMSTIQQQTGKSGSYRTNSRSGVSRRRVR